MSVPSGPTVTSADELIVDQRFLQPIRDRLTERGVWTDRTVPVANDDLQLVLLRGLHAAGPAAAIGDELAGRVGALGLSDPLDVVMLDLQLHLGTLLGAVPVMDKHHDAYVAYPQHKSGPVDPQPRQAPTPPSAAAASGQVRVGVVDVPPERDHPFLEGRVDSDAWLEPGVDHSAAWAGHGTFVAGAVLAAAPGARVVVHAAMDPDTGTGTAWDVAGAIAAFRDEDIAVLNLSFGCVTVGDRPPVLIERALATLPDTVLVIAAAGNVGSHPVDEAPQYLWPAAAHDVTAVGSHAVGDPHTVDGDTLPRRWVDAIAAGVDVDGCYVHGKVTLDHDDGTASEIVPFDGGAQWSGTSFAAARASGLVAHALTPGTSARAVLADLLGDHDSGIAPVPDEQRA